MKEGQRIDRGWDHQRVISSSGLQMYMITLYNKVKKDASEILIPFFPRPTQHVSDLKQACHPIEKPGCYSKGME
jgi:hypothetical protein